MAILVQGLQLILIVKDICHLKVIAVHYLVITCITANDI